MTMPWGKDGALPSMTLSELSFHVPAGGGVPAVFRNDPHTESGKTNLNSNRIGLVLLDSYAITFVMVYFTS